MATKDTIEIDVNVGEHEVNAVDIEIKRLQLMKMTLIMTNDGKYVALVTQSGVLAPTAIVLENTLGVSTSFTYDGAGQYLLNATGAFASGKVVFYSSQPSSDAQMVTGQMDSNDTYFIGTIDNNLYTNGILSNTTIEIIVYV